MNHRMPNDKYQMTNTRMPEIMCQVRIEPCHLPFAIWSLESNSASSAL